MHVGRGSYRDFDTSPKAPGANRSRAVPAGSGHDSRLVAVADGPAAESAAGHLKPGDESLFQHGLCKPVAESCTKGILSQQYDITHQHDPGNDHLALSGGSVRVADQLQTFPHWHDSDTIAGRIGTADDCLLYVGNRRPDAPGSANTGGPRRSDQPSAVIAVIVRPKLRRPYDHT